jgi:hypothetical protein
LVEGKEHLDIFRNMGNFANTRKLRRWHREALVIMERAFGVNDIFAIAYSKQLSI